MSTDTAQDRCDLPVRKPELVFYSDKLDLHCPVCGKSIRSIRFTADIHFCQGEITAWDFVALLPHWKRRVMGQVDCGHKWIAFYYCDKFGRAQSIWGDMEEEEIKAQFLKAWIELFVELGVPREFMDRAAKEQQWVVLHPLLTDGKE